MEPVTFGIKVPGGVAKEIRALYEIAVKKEEDGEGGLSFDEFLVVVFREGLRRFMEQLVTRTVAKRVADTVSSQLMADVNSGKITLEELLNIDATIVKVGSSCDSMDVEVGCDEDGLCNSSGTQSEGDRETNSKNGAS